MSTILIDEPADGISTITLNKPERLNAFDSDMLAALLDAIDGVSSSNRCRVVILTGAGRGFCAGADLKADFDGNPAAASVDGLVNGISRLGEVTARLRRMAQPVIAAVNGPAVGGGFGFALAADVRLVADSAVFALAQITLGLLPAEVGISYLLPRIIGEGRAGELMLTGRSVDAAEAVRIGLANAQHRDGELQAAALAMATTIAGMSPTAVHNTKAALRAGVSSPSMEHTLEAEARWQALMNFTPSIQEAIARFRRSRVQ